MNCLPNLADDTIAQRTIRAGGLAGLENADNVSEFQDESVPVEGSGDLMEFSR